MNLYKVGHYVEDDGSGKPGLAWEEVKAGDLAVESGCLIFKRTPASNEVVMAYREWNRVIRVSRDG